MSKRKWQIMDFILGREEITAYDLVDAWGVTLENARMMLLRSYKQRWLNRRKVREGGIIVYAYRLSDKALRFLDEFGSFLDHKWYG